MQNDKYSNILWYEEQFSMSEHKIQHFDNFIFKIFGELWGHDNDIINPLICIFILMFCIIFHEKVQIFKTFITSLFWQILFLNPENI